MYDKIILNDFEKTTYEVGSKFYYGARSGEITNIVSQDGSKYIIYTNSGLWIDVPFSAVSIAVGHLVPFSDTVD